MRLIATVLAAVLSFAASASAAVEVVRVWPGWRDADSFTRIAEHFGAAESHGRETVLRTQPTARDGYYFLTRLKNTGGAQDARVELHVIRPDAPEPKVFTFPVTLPAKERVFHFGLTGSDWPDGEKAHPVAWKLVILTTSGSVLAEHKSFLWEKPAK